MEIERKRDKTNIDRKRDRDREIVWKDMKRDKTTDRRTEIQIENETDMHTSRLERCEKHNDL